MTEVLWIQRCTRKTGRTFLGGLLPLIATSTLFSSGVQATSAPNQARSPRRAIPLVAPIPAYAGQSAMPTVVVPATSPTESVAPALAHVPPVAWERIPPAAAARLAAYLVPLNDGVWVTLVGPRGMRGTAALADDGGVALTLTNGSTTLRLVLESASTLAAEQEGDLFPAAGRVDNAIVAGSWTPARLLHPATIVYRQDHHLALFAYQDRAGQNVYGVGYYDGRGELPGLGAEGVTVTYAATGADAHLAPWVMATAKQLITVPLEAFAVSRTRVTIPGGTSPVTVTVPRGTAVQGLALRTGRAIVWVAVPRFVDSSVPVAPLTPRESHGFPVWGLIPTGPFAIERSPLTTRRLVVSGHTETVTAVASLELSAGGVVAKPNAIALLRVTRTGWLLYRVANDGVGTKPTLTETIEAVRLKPNQSPTTVTTFAAHPGTTLFLGSLGNEIVYDRSSGPKPNPANLVEVDLATGTRRTLRPSALQGTLVRFRVDGSPHIVKLTAVGRS